MVLHLIEIKATAQLHAKSSCPSFTRVRSISSLSNLCPSSLSLFLLHPVLVAPLVAPLGISFPVGRSTLMFDESLYENEWFAPSLIDIVNQTVFVKLVREKGTVVLTREYTYRFILRTHEYCLVDISSSFNIFECSHCITLFRRNFHR